MFVSLFFGGFPKLFSPGNGRCLGVLTLYWLSGGTEGRLMDWKCFEIDSLTFEMHFLSSLSSFYNAQLCFHVPTDIVLCVKHTGIFAL